MQADRASVEWTNADSLSLHISEAATIAGELANASTYEAQKELARELEGKARQVIRDLG